MNLNESCDNNVRCGLIGVVNRGEAVNGTTARTTDLRVSASSSFGQHVALVKVGNSRMRLVAKEDEQHFAILLGFTIRRGVIDVPVEFADRSHFSRYAQRHGRNVGDGAKSGQIDFKQRLEVGGCGDLEPRLDRPRQNS